MKEIPEEVRAMLDRSLAEDMSEEEFLRVVFVGDCPACESVNTTSCDETEGIDDPTVALCKDCGFIWCTECVSPLEKGESCGHWDVCDACEEPSDEFGDCGVDPYDCPNIVEWLQGGEAPAPVGCAWCDHEMPSKAEVFAVGAKLKEGIEVVTGETSPDVALFDIIIAGKPVMAIVSAPGSEARMQGNDLLFMVCSKECARKLRDALQSERDMIERACLN